MAETVWQARGVRRVFGPPSAPVVALAGVDLEVAPGDLWRVTGPSGSGKTTLLGVLGLVDPGYEGSYRFAGREARALPEGQRRLLRLRQVATAFQDHHLVPSLTAHQNLAVVALAAGASEEAASRRASELLAACGLLPRAGHLPATLSGGERRRVVVARALVNRPRLLLLDEPTSNLDAESAAVVQRLAMDAHAGGAAVVAATHDPGFLRGSRELRLQPAR